MYWMRALLLGLMAVCGLGCGELGGSTPKDAGGTCVTDSDCGAGKVCHPLTQACVASCISGSDCPMEQKTCARFDGTSASATSPGFCQCGTNDTLCNTAQAGNVCSRATKQCAPRCTAAAGCSAGLRCDADAGQCLGGAADGGLLDGGVDGGMDAGVTCTSSAPQPDVCGYGHQCNTAMSCDEASDDRCGNVTAAISGGFYTPWEGHSDTGPIIYFISDDVDVSAGCSDSSTVAYTATIWAYAGPNYVFPATIGDATQLTYYLTSGAPSPVNNVLVGTMAFPFASYTPSNGGKNVAIKLTICGPSGSTSIPVAFSFSHGNALCTTLSHQ